ncbi:hypothetical protein EOD39_15385 [Acipenser ruthenus]|uniref:Uncharacterized protein n=1 Tax=Acipenser ruthenus TaxID=7906 RepID=A0A662YL08_ACIRT|nr:hypothetical protein EOD39_15385 [Acipenser ruthenus]
MPRPHTKRMSQSLTGSEQNTAITENGEEPLEVVKKRRFKQKAAELPDGRALQVHNSKPVLTGRLQAPARAPVPHNAGEENTVEGGPGAVQDSPLAESQPPEKVVAGEREEAAETGAKELEGAAEELTLGAAQLGWHSERLAERLMVELRGCLSPRLREVLREELSRGTEQRQCSLFPGMIVSPAVGEGGEGVERIEAHY